MDPNDLNTSSGRNVLVIGAGLHGLVTAKVLLHDSNKFFDSVTIFEKNSELGGVWASNRIYNGLTTNSPALTYEIPGYRFPEALRKTGQHVSAKNVNQYFQSFADRYGVSKRIQFRTQVDDISWESNTKVWKVTGISNEESFSRAFSHIVICTGLYHTSFNPLKLSQTKDYRGKIYHSSEMGKACARSTMTNSKNVVVVGAGKSALDLATILARGQWDPNVRPVSVSLVYRKAHWLSPRKIVRGTVPFEMLLFSRFVTAWLPFVNYPDHFHRLIAETWLGRWSTRKIFDIIGDDFIKSLGQQEVPQTVSNMPLATALSGALHVEPVGYLESVKGGQIEILPGTIKSLKGNKAVVSGDQHGEVVIDADNVLLATGYKLALPFFSNETLKMLQLVKPEELDIEDKTDFPYIRLYRLALPPGTVHKKAPIGARSDALPHQNIAFNGFAYSLLNPTVAHVTAHWISDYFQGVLDLPDQTEVERDISDFHRWQTKCFGVHGAKGVHIGPHATLYTDLLIKDMRLRTGQILTSFNPVTFLRAWFRPMFPQIYADLGLERQGRDSLDNNVDNYLGKAETSHLFRLCTLVLSFWSTYIIAGVFFLYFCGFSKGYDYFTLRKFVLK